MPTCQIPDNIYELVNRCGNYFQWMSAQNHEKNHQVKIETWQKLIPGTSGTKL